MAPILADSPSPMGMRTTASSIRALCPPYLLRHPAAFALVMSFAALDLCYRLVMREPLREWLGV